MCVNAMHMLSNDASNRTNTYMIHYILFEVYNDAPVGWQVLKNDASIISTSGHADA